MGAAQRGVKVQILVDGINGMFFCQTAVILSSWFPMSRWKPGFIIPLICSAWRTNYRMHDKYLIADDWGIFWEAEIQTTGFWDIIRKAITRIGICWSMERSRDKVVLFRRWKHIFMRFGISPAVRSLMQKAV